ncbi:hypothetical protein F4777DRAFT_183947 [Nemania sp. FL0916]|nr:hypothetical protein F4777DRAFT_183947 [Nemania sp. FL0916]
MFRLSVQVLPRCLLPRCHAIQLRRAALSEVAYAPGSRSHLVLHCMIHSSLHALALSMHLLPICIYPAGLHSTIPAASQHYTIPPSPGCPSTHPSTHPYTGPQDHRRCGAVRCGAVRCVALVPHRLPIAYRWSQSEARTRQVCVASQSHHIPCPCPRGSRCPVPHPSIHPGPIRS